MFNLKLKAINNLLDLHDQNWLFGAGVSYNANIPLMFKLTELVEGKIEEIDNQDKMYTELKKLFEGKENMHIEHILSHIGDLIAMIDRTGGKEISINNYNYNIENLQNLYNNIIEQITSIVKYGYVENEKKLGSIEKPLVEIAEHRYFVKALFSRLENLEGRHNVSFFTTNYDTLLEDALILEEKKIVDGFEGGAMGFWMPETFSDRKPNEYLICKLHGSIDWYHSDSEGLIRTRYGTTYLKDEKNTMIYPQATKYVETQKDPFALLFEQFRSALIKSDDSVLGVCGYSFGDNHINFEIEFALKHPGNQLTLLIFLKESDEGLPEILQKWLGDSKINNRIYIMTQKGIYHEGILDKNTYELDWWSFEGVTELLIKGEEYDVSQQGTTQSGKNH